MTLPDVMTDADVVTAIRAQHLALNISPHEREPLEWGDNVDKWHEDAASHQRYVDRRSIDQ